jgi:sialate O-acetylesterase
MTGENMNNRSVGTVTWLILVAAILLSPLPASAAKKSAGKAAEEPAAKPKPAIELGAPFADNAILQRQMKVPVWGWSKPGTKVTVEFAGQKQTAEAGKDGKWVLALDPLDASAAPQEMVITDSVGNKVTLKNILVGEVWMASGQSNMQWLAGKCDVATLLARVAERVKAGKEKQPVIREFQVTSVFSALHPVEHATGGWKDDDFGNYSAVAVAFAYELYRELGIPIGILNCSFSQTSIQTWTPRVGFRDGKDEYTQAIYKKILESDPTTPEHKAAWDKFYKDAEDTIARNAELVKSGKPAAAISTGTPGNLGGNRDASWMYNGRLHPVVPYAIRGAIWNQCYANIGEGFLYYNNLHSLIRGWREVWGQGDFPVYFHQLYAPGCNDGLSLNPMAEMRLGAWQARDIPNVGMACQIDITGAIHYRDKALPGKRLALHALKNQYAKKIVADGSMFKDYKVDGDKLTVEFEYADGGLLVGNTTMGNSLNGPTVFTNGEDKVTLFYVAGKDRVWHRAKMKIDGQRVVLTAAGVAEPCGVAYACNGVGELPNLYNRALLPMAPFIYYDHKLITSDTWPDKPVKVEGVKVDPSTVGKQHEYRKMPLLSAQFRDNAVFQSGMPVTIWGSAIHDWGYEAKGKAEIKFSFAPRSGSGQAGVEKTIPVTPGMREWRVTVPAMQASAEPKTLKVVFEIDGEVAHESVCKNIVVGDVWYVSAPDRQKEAGSKGEGVVRVMTRRAKRSTSPHPSRYSVSISTTPDNQYASKWENADGGFAGALGQRIHAKTGKPVGIICMSGDELDLKHWISYDCLKQAPSLTDDYKQLAAVDPGNPYYDANVRRYIADWKKYWSESVPRLMATKRALDGAAWGSYPSLSGSVTTEASQAYNVMVHCFGPGSFKGIIFLCGANMCKKDQGANYGAELSVLANCWKDWFAPRQGSGQGGEDPHFFYTIPSKELAPKITQPQGIKGKSTAFEINQWLTAKSGDRNDMDVVDKQLIGLIDLAVREVYK